MAKLTRSERIKKLGNAIKRYRGEYRPSQQVEGRPIQWLTPPDPSASDDIVRWFRALGYTGDQISEAFKKIGEPSLRCDSGFKNHDEFGEFMGSIK